MAIDLKKVVNPRLTSVADLGFNRFELVGVGSDGVRNETTNMLREIVFGEVIEEPGTNLCVATLPEIVLIARPDPNPDVVVGSTEESGGGVVWEGF